MIYRVFRKKLVFFSSKNFQNFATIPLAIPGLLLVVQKISTVWLNTLTAYKRCMDDPTGRGVGWREVRKNTFFPDHPVISISALIHCFKAALLEVLIMSLFFEARKLCSSPSWMLPENFFVGPRQKRKVFEWLKKTCKVEVATRYS